MNTQTSEWGRQEGIRIRERRTAAFHENVKTPEKGSAEAKERPRNLVGLALSGGGIRSALYTMDFCRGCPFAASAAT